MRRVIVLVLLMGGLIPGVAGAQSAHLVEVDADALCHISDGNYWVVFLARTPDAGGMATSDLLNTPIEVGSDWTNVGMGKWDGHRTWAELEVTVTWPDGEQVVTVATPLGGVCRELDCDEYGRCDPLYTYGVTANRPHYAENKYVLVESGQQHVSTDVNIRRLCRKVRVTVTDGTLVFKWTVPTRPRTLVRVWDRGPDYDGTNDTLLAAVLGRRCR
jgi:hypothetical protein